MNPLHIAKIKLGFVPKRLIIIISISCISFYAVAQLNANFSASSIAGCSPLQVNFTDISTGSPTSWNWNFGNGSGSSTLQNPSSFYVTPGVYSVTLTITKGSAANTKIKTNYILVYNKPLAGFTLSSDTICNGRSVIFTDATVISPGGPAIATWAWDFGDGFSSSVTTPTVTHTYSTPGNYPVSVTVTDVNGCSGNIVKNIVVLPKPTLSFIATPSSACTAPLNVTFTNTSTSTGTATYLWHFGDGTTSNATNPIHTYTASGTYNVTMYLNQHGCIDSLVKLKTIVIQKVLANYTATPSTICSGNSIKFTNTSVPATTTAYWDFGDTATSTLINPTHIYPTAGIYTVTLIASDANGCKDTTEATVTINQTPVADFIADTTAACSVPLTVNFTNTSTGGTNYIWNFGDGSPTSILKNPLHTYTAQGTYSVMLIASNTIGSCIDTLAKNFFIVIAQPVAGFLSSPDSGCAPLTINFTNISTSPVDPIKNYIWSFGDGSSEIAAPPLNHTYTTTGFFTPSLVIQTVHGCSDTVSCLNCLRTGIKPNAKFGLLQDTVCYDRPVVFSDSSANATGWKWDFGDGQFNINQNPQHIYADTGTYQVALIAFNRGCSDTSLIKKVVVLPPKAIFSYKLNCTNYFTVQFTSNSHGADSLVWDFGDGTKNTMNLPNITHTYLSRGSFTVALAAYNYVTGCCDSITKSFIIAEPIASYSSTASKGCYPFTVNLASTSQDAISYYWNLGDPSSTLDTSITDTASWTYKNPGEYSIRFIITDVNGCKDTLIDTLKSLGALPYFHAVPLTGCRPLIVTFQDTSVSDSTLAKWIWDFGDGSSIVSTNFDSIIHTYTTTGIFNVTMTVRDTNGCAKTIVKNGYIKPTFPNPSFTVDTFACKLDVISYDASATKVTGGAYHWNFGDGNSITILNPITTHVYSNDGNYTVSLSVTDTNGCDSTTSKIIQILKPTSNFSWRVDTVYCGNMQILFNDLSTGYVSSWRWNFGDGGSSAIQNPTHTYQTGGVYSVTLIVTNAGGCMDTFRLDSIISVPFAKGNFTISSVAGCNPLITCFNSSAMNTSAYIWDFGDGAIGNCLIGDTCHAYTNQGLFFPHLILQYTLPNGTYCVDTATNVSGSVLVSNVLNVSLSGNPPITGPPYSVTIPADSIISVSANYTGGTPPYTFRCSPDTGISCNTCSSVLVIGTGDTILYTFSVYDALGCIGTDSILVFSEPCFEEKIIPNVFSPNADGVNDVFYIPGVCPGEKYSLHIYDRWGTLIFSSSIRKNGWDGRTNAGVEANEGVYYVILQIDENIYKKAVNLIR